MPAVVPKLKPFRLLVTLALVLITAVFSAAQTPGKNCVSNGAKCGLPVVYLQSQAGGDHAGSDLFDAVRSANPSLYPSAVEYHVYFDSRSGKVSFQDDRGVNVKPGLSARNFIAVFHDGSSTDWRTIDATLAGRVPATAKADQLAHIVWAIKSATLTPRVILEGGSEELAVAQYYVAGKAGHQFDATTHTYNNDIHGTFSTDNKVAPDSALPSAAGIAALEANTATAQYPTKNILIAGSAVGIVDGISAPSTSVNRGQSVQFTSNIGPVVWSVLEGPSAGTINRAGLFTSASNKGSAHIVGVSVANHATIAVSAIPLTPSPTGPVLTTTAVSSITSATATFNGTVNPNGQSGVVGFQYSKVSTFSPATTSSTVAASGSTTTSFSIPQTRLTPNTLYYVRSYFRNSTTNVTTLGPSVIFNTFGSFVSGAGASLVTSSDVTLNAYANGGGVAGFVYFTYSIDNFAHVLNTAHIAVPGDRVTHKVSIRVPALKTSTPYKFKAVFDQGAQSPALQFSPVVSFNTWGIFAENAKPVWATAITRQGATFPGKYGTGAGPANVWLEISKSPTFATGASVYGLFSVAAGDYTYHPLSITVNTLSANTTYYVRYAIKNTENGFTYRYPFIRSFQTLP